jgi:hypothetical protein
MASEWGFVTRGHSSRMRCGSPIWSAGTHDHDRPRALDARIVIVVGDCDACLTRRSGESVCYSNRFCEPTLSNPKRCTVKKLPPADAHDPSTFRCFPINNANGHGNWQDPRFVIAIRKMTDPIVHSLKKLGFSVIISPCDVSLGMIFQISSYERVVDVEDKFASFRTSCAGISN